MGMFLLTTIKNTCPRDMHWTDMYCLEFLANKADDNTSESVVNGNRRMNFIGAHAYPSISSLSKDLRKSRSSLTTSIKRLKDNNWIQVMDKDDSSNISTTMYCVNVSKIFRYLDYRETVKKLKLDEYNEKVEKFFESVDATYDTDFSDPSVKTLKTVGKGLVIENWEDLVDNNQLEEYWTTYREKEISTWDSADLHKQLKETPDISTSNDSTYRSSIANAQSLEEVFPVPIVFLDQDGQPHKYTMSYDHINDSGFLDSSLLNLPDEEYECFNDPTYGCEYLVQRINAQFHEKMREYAKNRKEPTS